MHEVKLNNLVYRTEGKLARLTLNRPEALNAFSVELVAELDAVSQLIDDDREIRVVAITGAGRAFSAGIDLKALSRGEIDHAYLVQWERFLHRLETMEKVVVCLCHGYFIGGGLQLALACDIRVMSDDAVLGLPASAEGVPPGMAPWRLPRYIGLGRTLRLAILGEQIDAEEALRIGLADHVVPAGRFAEHAAALVERYKRVPQAAAQATKELARSSFDTDFTTAYARSRELVQQCLDTADAADARAAWLRRHK